MEMPERNSAYPAFPHQTFEQRERARQYVKKTMQEADDLARKLQFSAGGITAFVLEKVNISYKRALYGLSYESPQWTSMDIRFSF